MKRKKEKQQQNGVVSCDTGWFVALLYLTLKISAVGVWGVCAGSPRRGGWLPTLFLFLCENLLFGEKLPQNLKLEFSLEPIIWQGFFPKTT